MSTEFEKTPQSVHRMAVGIVAAIVILFIGLLVWGAASSGNTNNNAADNTDQSKTKEKPNDIDQKAAEIKASAKSGECDYETTGEALFTVHGLYGSHMGNFASLGKRVFSGDDSCKDFYYTLYANSVDSKGNDTKVMAMMLHITREDFEEYNWDNLQGEPMYNRLNNAGVIQMMNTNGVDTDKIRLGTVE